MLCGIAFAQSPADTETLSRKGSRYYFSNDTARNYLSDTDLKLMFDEEMFEKYEKGRSLYRKGVIFGIISADLVVGGGLAILGGYGLMCWDNNPYYILGMFGYLSTWLGIYACIAGVGLAIPTTVFAITGKSKLNRVRDNYNSGLERVSSHSAQLQFNVSPMQVGLSLSF